MFLLIMPFRRPPSSAPLITASLQNRQSTQDNTVALTEKPFGLQRQIIRISEYSQHPSHSITLATMCFNHSRILGSHQKLGSLNVISFRLQLNHYPMTIVDQPNTNNGPSGMELKDTKPIYRSDSQPFTQHQR